MRKIITLLIVLFLVPNVLAISTDINKTYQPGETMIIEVLGNILEPILRTDIELKRANVQVPFEYDVKRLGNSYFMYGILPSAENSYTLFIKDITTTVNGRVTKEDFRQDIQTSGELIPYSIKPGFKIVGLGEEFEFKIFLNRDIPEPIRVDFPEEQEITLFPGENVIKFIAHEIELGLNRIQIGIYSIPVLVEESEARINVINLLPELRFFPRNIESAILFDEEIVYPFKIINDGDVEIIDIGLEFNPEIFIIEPATITSIGANETRDFNLTLRKKNEPINESVILRSGDFLSELGVNVFYTENLEETGTPYLGEDYSEVQGYYCSELGGVQSCSSNEECSRDTIATLDNPVCCLGSCEARESEGSSFAWVGYLIGAIILITLVIIAGRYMKTRKRKDPFGRRVREAQSTRSGPPISKKSF